MSQPIDLHPDPIPCATPMSPGGHRVPAALFAAAADREDWQQRALCAQTDPEAFFPEQGGSTAEAKAVCARCPFTAECLEHVLARDERFGVWAGMSEAERRKPLQAARVERAAARRAADQAAATRAAGNDLSATQDATRESAPTPGPSRHVGGTGPVATLPTEPRHPRGRPQHARTRSTFPERARQPRPADTPPTALSPAAVTRPAPRPTPGDRGVAGRGQRSAGRGGPAVVAPPAGADLDSAELVSSGRPGPEPAAPAGDTTHAGPEATTERSVEAGAATAAGRPPDPPPLTPPTGSGTTVTAAATRDDELLGAVTDVLAAQPNAPRIDPVVVVAGHVGSGADLDSPSVGEWELRILAVAWVISGRATRGQTARAFGVPSPAVAHWVARHQQQMPLCAPGEENL